MKPAAKATAFLAAICVAGILLNWYERERHSLWNTLQAPALIDHLKRFVVVKKAQADSDTNGVPAEFQAMFKYAEHGDWLAMSHSFSELEQRKSDMERCCGPGDLRGKVKEFISGIVRLTGWDWSPEFPPQFVGTSGEAVHEVYGAFEAFADGHERYAQDFGRDIIASIPNGSIYISSNNPGRFIVTAMCPSQTNGDPFYCLASDALADPAYVNYVRQRYEKNIYMPTPGDWQKCLEDYVKDAIHRRDLGQLQPGECAFVEKGLAQVAGQVSLMKISDLVCQTIFDGNPKREFYVQASFQTNWMYPLLEPHGLIFRLNRQPEMELSADVVRQDHEYWARHVRPVIGDWLTESTSVGEIAGFAEKAFARRDFDGFKGDTNFVQQGYSQSMLSESRAAFGRLYAWRASHSDTAADRERMLREANYAYEQAWALGPNSIKVEVWYTDFLAEQSRFNEALEVAQTAVDISRAKGEQTGQFDMIIWELKDRQSQPTPVGQN